MKKYICSIPRGCGPTPLTCEVSTTSALKCANVLGHASPDEVVLVYGTRGLISAVRWDSQARKYIRTYEIGSLTDLLPGTQRAIVVTDQYAAVECLQGSFPRMCGGDPSISDQAPRTRDFSPHVRG